MKIFGTLLAALGGIVQLQYAWRMFEWAEKAATYDAARAEIFFRWGLIGAGIGTVILVLAFIAFMSLGRLAGFLMTAITIAGIFTNTAPVLNAVVALPAGLLIFCGGWLSRMRME